jgi:endonuclease/exonuclease/phosphatase family metal-dependent hydrolase
MLRAVLRLVLALAVFLAGACQEGGVAPGADGAPLPGDGGTGYPPPRADLVPAIGSAGSLDLATWNIQNFPLTDETPSLVADLVTSLELDFVAVQEIANLDAWDELVARLPLHGGLLSSHTYGDGSYQKVGFLYREDLVRVEAGTLLFQDRGFDFPRPPLQVRVTVIGAAPALDFFAIVLHLKAGTGSDDRQRRTDAMVALEEHVRDLVSSGAETELLVLGDFNEHLDAEFARQVFAPFLDAPADYQVHTDELEAAEASFIPSGRVIDHLITTAALSEEMAAGAPVIPRLDSQLFGYLDRVSDHLPVAAALSLPD